LNGDAGNHGLLSAEVFAQDGTTKEQKYAVLVFVSFAFSFWTFMRVRIFSVHDWGLMNGNITTPDALMMLCDFAPDTLFAQFPLSVEEPGL